MSLDCLYISFRSAINLFLQIFVLLSLVYNACSAWTVAMQITLIHKCQVFNLTVLLYVVTLC